MNIREVNQVKWMKIPGFHINHTAVYGDGSIPVDTNTTWEGEHER